MNKLYKIFKKIIFAPFIVYIYNWVASPLGYTIPINFFSIFVIFFFGFYGLFGLIVLYFFIF